MILFRDSRKLDTISGQLSGLTPSRMDLASGKLIWKASVRNSAPWVSRLYSLPLSTTVLFLLVDGFTDDAGAGVWSVASLVLGDSKWRAKKHILNEKTWGICEEFDNGLRRLLAAFADTQR